MDNFFFVSLHPENQEVICTMALRYFKEDMPGLHVIAAGSLLEFVLDDIPTFGVGRVHSMYMFPMTFDEFLLASNEQLLIEARRQANVDSPLPMPLHDKLVGLVRTYMLVGGMPESVVKWVETHDYLMCQEVQDDIISGYEADESIRKMLLLDTGLMLRLLNMQIGDTTAITTHILTSTAADLVNKGPVAEMLAGLELLSTTH